MDKQHQEVGEGALAIQAKGDVSVVRYGLSVAEVRELTDLFLEQKLPVLKQHAADVASDNARSFCEAFTAQLAQPNKVTEQSFSKPDSQACFHDALKNCALKGSDVDFDMMSKLLIQRLEVDDDMLLKLVYEHALKALPLLTKQHIAFLTFTFVMKNIAHGVPKQVFEMEHFHQVLLPLMEPGFGMSAGNREYMSGLGVLDINLVADADSSRGRMMKFIAEPHPSNDDFANVAPITDLLIKRYGQDSVATIFLTSSGKMIAVQALRSIFTDLNPSTWIN